MTQPWNDSALLPGNLLQHIPDALPNELFSTLLQTPGIRIERIVSRGHVTPEDQWYDQHEHEWILLVQGQARLRFADEPADRQLSAGDYLNIPAHARHRVTWTAPDTETIWLAVFYS